MLLSYVMFFLAGLGFGYAAFGLWKWLPLLLPIGLFLIAAFAGGVDGTSVIRLLVALIVAAAGVVIGALLERRELRTASARYA